MTGITYHSTTTGLYPIPDGAKEALLTSKGRQRDDLIDGTEGPEIEEIYADARKALISWQQEAALDRIVEGQARWDDMLGHPLAVHPAVETGGLRRYYDNNNFYRELTVTGPLTPVGDVAGELGEAAQIVDSDDLQAVLPGPVSLFDLATDEQYGSDAAFLEGITNYLVAEIESLPVAATCLLLEPSLTERRCPVERGAAIDALEAVTEAVATAGIRETIIHSYWGSPSDDIYRDLLDLDGVGIGYDLITAAERSSTHLSEYGAPSTVLFGVVDSQNTRIEVPSEIIATADEALVTEEIETVFLAPHAEGFYLPTNRFREKLQALGRAVDRPEVSA